jgi:hypothetical protein
MKKVSELCATEKRTLNIGPQLWYHVENYYFMVMDFIRNYPSTVVNIITKHIQLKQLLNKEFRNSGLPYHIYSVGTDCSRLDSHQDHNDSQDNHHTLSQVVDIVRMGTKDHCMVVVEQKQRSLLQQ